MAEPIITVEHLSKKYRISHQGQRGQYTTLRDVLAARSKSLLSSFKSRQNTDPAVLAGRSSVEDFWALKDVSFEVKQGEVLGIIGRNGAGKSTLLKVLSRITDPTEGRVRIRGRVASLLEVGTGFHPELTGRENIFLNGAILGMSRVEIKRKFDEIVDFAGVEKFLDTPVKRYSSGMYVRLAFAVAAHLEPEILIVDEVLAVGDAEFQKKCLGKMKDVSTNDGRTVLFVSHNLTAVAELCSRSLLFASGRIVADGTVDEVLNTYLCDATSSQVGEFDLTDHPLRSAQSTPILKKLTVRGGDGRQTSLLTPEEPCEFEIAYETVEVIKDARIAIAVEDSQGRRLMTYASYLDGGVLPEILGSGTVRCHAQPLRLAPGRYLLSVSIATRDNGLLDSLDGVAWFEVEGVNDPQYREPHLSVYGPIRTRSAWQCSDVSDLEMSGGPAR